MYFVESAHPLGPGHDRRVRGIGKIPVPRTLGCVDNYPRVAVALYVQAATRVAPVAQTKLQSELVRTPACIHCHMEQLTPPAATVCSRPPSWLASSSAEFGKRPVPRPTSGRRLSGSSFPRLRSTARDRSPP